MAGSHADLMDRVYRRQRFVYDVTRRYYLFGRDRMIRELSLRPGESLVEVGCGTARNLIKIARRYPGIRLFGLDASAEMLRTASLNLTRAGLGEQIKLVQGYAEELTPSMFAADKPFDHVLFSYSLSMIPDWNQALSAAEGALCEHGRLHVVDFGDLTGLGPVAAGLMRAWLHLFHVEPRVEILRVLEELPPQLDDRRERVLHLLPARYAFLWTTEKASSRGLGLHHVAGQTQEVGNSPELAGSGG